MKFVSGFPVAFAAEHRAIVGELFRVSQRLPLHNTFEPMGNHTIC